MAFSCSDVNGKTAHIVKGWSRGTWWMIWMTMMCLVPTVIILPLHSDTLGVCAASMTLAGIACLGFGISLYVWPVRVWRTHLPLRFSRKTRKVYFHRKGKTYIEDWDSLRAYLKIQGGVTGVGAPMRDPQINIEFRSDDGSPLTVFLMGADKLGLTVEEETVAFWEYIRRYMEEGPENLPAPDLDMWKPVPYEELYKTFWPFPIHTLSGWWWWPLEIALYPIRVA
jgi:Family of unknown function (DUF6708)